MNKFPFHYEGGLIIVKVTIYGFTEKAVPQTLNLGLDTGSTHTIIIPGYLSFLDYPLATATKVKITTGSQRADNGLMLPVKKLEAFNIPVYDLKVVEKQLPKDLYFLDGLLGVDFFRKAQQLLCIHFQNQTIIIQ